MFQIKEYFFEFVSRYFLLQFIKNLIKKIKAKAIVGGYDCQFGKNRKGNLDYLKHFAEENNWIFREVPPLTINNKIVSSTEIRKAIQIGNFSLVENFLGRPWTIRAIVVKGHRVGRIVSGLRQYRDHISGGFPSDTRDRRPYRCRDVHHRCV